jgi:3-phosphoshikimate 1-carboxyvinyltransferase
MYCLCSAGSLNGEIRVPGSKSHTIRAALLAAMAEGTSVIHNPLASRDCLSALRAARAFGADVIEEKDRWILRGTGGKPMLPENVVDCGNSGTTTNFVMSLAALCEGYTVITGDYQVRRRPVIELVRALNGLGAEVFPARPGGETPPVIVKGIFSGGTARFSGFNSQVVSSLLLSAPLARGDTLILVDHPLEKPYLQMSVDWMQKYGVSLTEQADDYTRLAVAGSGGYGAVDSVIPADWSGVIFPLVAALCTPSELAITGLDFNDVQGDKIVVDYLTRMGAGITRDIPGGRLLVRGGKPLKGGMTINLNDIPDSLPALSVAACFAEGDTTFTGLAHVRVKETDRVAVMETELAKMGAKFSLGPDRMTVHGGAPLRGAEVDSRDDHRVAMALAVAGLFAAGETRVKGAECVPVSFPGFFDLMRRLGASFELREDAGTETAC